MDTSSSSFRNGASLVAAGGIAVGIAGATLGYFSLLVTAAGIVAATTIIKFLIRPKADRIQIQPELPFSQAGRRVEHAVSR